MIKSFENKASTMPEFSADHSFWLKRLQSDINELQKRESEIKKCETNYKISKLSDCCVKILINIIPKEGVFSNYEFQVKLHCFFKKILGF